MDTKENKERTLSDAFKELQQARMNSRIQNENNVFLHQINNLKKSRLKTKKQGISLGIISLAIIFITIIGTFANRIFAYNNTDKTETIKATAIEANVESIEIENIISENISSIQRKELVTEKRSIPFETSYKENASLPKDEQIVLQPGQQGEKAVTVVKIYQTQNGLEEFKEENILNETITSVPQEQIVEVGTSEVLEKYKVHVGDIVYTVEETPMRDMADINSNVAYKIGKYMDVRIIGVEGDFLKVTYGIYSGYIESSFVVSEATNPEYVQKCKIQKVINNLNLEMDVSKPSGLSLEDFKKILSDNPRDVNKIFESNAESFYQAELKYNINGLLVVAIGIHESAWGTSAIAKDKNNLFGYGAYDSDPYNSAFTFTTYAEGIDTVAKSLAKNYLNPAGKILFNGETATGKYFSGTSIASINKRYATDTNWGNAVYNIMEGLYEKLQ